MQGQKLYSEHYTLAVYVGQDGTVELREDLLTRLAVRAQRLCCQESPSIELQTAADIACICSHNVSSIVCHMYIA
jgi:hypothetical protein